MAIKIGTSGWSYPSWRPGFYPADLQPVEFLRFYAQRFDTVELNSTGYRLPSADQFRRWADTVPDGFEFAVKSIPPPKKPVTASTRSSPKNWISSTKTAEASCACCAISSAEATDRAGIWRPEWLTMTPSG